MDDEREKLLRRREDVRRQLALLSPFRRGDNGAHARQRTSRQILGFLLADLNRELGPDESQSPRQ